MLWADGIRLPGAKPGASASSARMVSAWEERPQAALRRMVLVAVLEPGWFQRARLAAEIQMARPQRIVPAGSSPAMRRKSLKRELLLEMKLEANPAREKPSKRERGLPRERARVAAPNIF